MKKKKIKYLFKCFHHLYFVESYFYITLNGRSSGKWTLKKKETSFQISLYRNTSFIAFLLFYQPLKRETGKGISTSHCIRGKKHFWLTKVEIILCLFLKGFFLLRNSKNLFTTYISDYNMFRKLQFSVKHSDGIVLNMYC